MKKTIYRLVAAAPFVVALAGCDLFGTGGAKGDFAPAPAPNAILSGTITGVTGQGVVLSNGGTTLEMEADGRFTFGALPVGTSYQVVVTPPIGRLCTVSANGSGTLAGNVRDVTVTCSADPNAPTFTVGGTVTGIPAGASGLVLNLSNTSQGGDEDLPVSGGAFVFPIGLLNEADYTVTVQTGPSGGGQTYQCAVSNGTGTIDAAGVGDVTNVAVSCSFTIGGTVAFNGPPSPIGAGLVLGLANAFGPIESLPYNPASASFTFAGAQPSTATATYAVTVATQPAGQVCVVRNAGGVSLATPGNVTSVSVLCQAAPLPANVLTGTYRTGRNYLTLFADGTFLYGAHSATPGITGVEHGFYSSNCCGPGSLFLTVTTDGNGAGGLSNAAVDGGFVFATGTTRGAGPPATLAFTTGGGSNPVVAWSFTAVDSTAGTLTGPWASNDRLRVFVYDGANDTVIHYGVNGGAANLQDLCMTLGAPVVAGADGSYLARNDAATCTIPGGLTPVNVDPSGGGAAFPGTPNAFGALTVDYDLTAGAPDTLSLQPTFFGGPFGPLQAFSRSEPN